MKAIVVAAGIVFLHTSVASAAEAARAGSVSIAAGPVSAIGLSGESRVLKKNDVIYSGDRVITGGSGYALLGFLDGGSMVLRPGTEFAIESFAFKPSQAAVAAKPVPPKSDGVPPALLQVGDQGGTGNRALFRLVRGGLRAVSGLVGKINREEYVMRSPVATIGIRGTTYIDVLCDVVCAADPSVLENLPAGESALGGTISGVDEGAISVTSVTGKTAVLQPGKFILTTSKGAQIALTSLPGFLKAESWLNGAQQAVAQSQLAKSETEKIAQRMNKSLDQAVNEGLVQQLANGNFVVTEEGARLLAALGATLGNVSGLTAGQITALVAAALGLVVVAADSGSNGGGLATPTPTPTPSPTPTPTPTPTPSPTPTPTPTPSPTPTPTPTPTPSPTPTPTPTPTPSPTPSPTPTPTPTPPPTSVPTEPTPPPTSNTGSTNNGNSNTSNTAGGT